MNCKVCNKELDIYAHHASHFCSTECRKTERARRDKLSREQRDAHIPSKVCRRCHVIFRALDKKQRFCTNCDIIIKRQETYHKCADCTKRVNIEKKRCYTCEQKSKAKRVKAQSDDVKKRSKVRKQERLKKGITKDDPKIDPKWLTRGNVSNSSISSVITNGS